MKYVAVAIVFLLIGFLSAGGQLRINYIRYNPVETIDCGRQADASSRSHLHSDRQLSNVAGPFQPLGQSSV